MKSIRFFKTCFIFWACLGFGLNAGAQERDDRPNINKVSVDPNDGKITIEWDVKSTDGVDFFVLYWYEEKPDPNYPPFDTVSIATRSYTFYYDEMKKKFPSMPNPFETSVSYAVGSFTPSAMPQRAISSPPHCTIHLRHEYDSCRSKITLHWNGYEGWSLNPNNINGLVSYHVMRIPGGEVEVCQPGQKSYSHVVNGVEDKDIYTYYIEAKRRDGETSTSYKTEQITNMPLTPKYIHAEKTEYNSDGFAEISFKIDPNAETHSYRFSGSGRPEYAFVPLGDNKGILNIYNDTTLTDIPPPKQPHLPPQPRAQTYYYRLEALKCPNITDEITATSNTATALWLILKQEGPVNLLRWEPYKNWGDDAQYSLHRQVDIHQEEIIATITDPENTTFVDEGLSSIFIDGDVCYWVTATPVFNSPEKTAISNKICIKPESNIYIPQAFTPNVIGINGEFRPFFSYPPKEYALYLYDRTGAKVFETKDVNAGWDGRLMNGKPASEGVYTYFLRFRTEMGRLVEKKGTFSLILP